VIIAYLVEVLSVRNAICCDHMSMRLEVQRSRSQDHIFMNKFCFLETLVDAHVSSVSVSIHVPVLLRLHV